MTIAFKPPSLPRADQIVAKPASRSPARTAAGARAKSLRKSSTVTAKAPPKSKATPKANVAPKIAAVPAVQAAKPVEKAGKPITPAKAGKPPKLRSKPVRDSFTMPEADFALIATLKARALAARRETKKSELLRAGLHALAAMEQAALMAALGQLEPVKIGRPKRGH